MDLRGRAPACPTAQRGQSAAPQTETGINSRKNMVSLCEVGFML